MRLFIRFPAWARFGRSFVVAAALTVLLAGPAWGAPEDRQAFSPPGTAAVYATGDATGVPGAWSLVTRNSSGLTMVIHAVGLTSGHAYAAWWVVFNAPMFCTHPNAVVGARCGNGDLPANDGDPRVQATMAYATGHVVNGKLGARTTDFADWLPADASIGPIFGPGLLDPAGAEVHLVLTDLGSASTELDVYQLRTLALVCAQDTDSCPVAQVSFQLS